MLVLNPATNTNENEDYIDIGKNSIIHRPEFNNTKSLAK